MKIPRRALWFGLAWQPVCAVLWGLFAAGMQWARPQGFDPGEGWAMAGIPGLSGLVSGAAFGGLAVWAEGARAAAEIPLIRAALGGNPGRRRRPTAGRQIRPGVGHVPRRGGCRRHRDRRRAPERARDMKVDLLCSGGAGFSGRRRVERGPAALQT
jgi:hypothetical protein